MKSATARTAKEPRGPRSRERVRRALELETREIEADGHVYERPRTRGDCADGPRPCPWVACRHHLYLDVNAETGTIILRFPDLQPEEMGASCSLDVADSGGQDLETVGHLAGDVSKEMARLVEVSALRRARVEWPEDDEP